MTLKVSLSSIELEGAEESIPITLKAHLSGFVLTRTVLEMQNSDFKPKFMGFSGTLRKTPETPFRNTLITLLLRCCGSVLKVFSYMITVHLKMCYIET